MHPYCYSLILQALETISNTVPFLSGSLQTRQRQESQGTQGVERGRGWRRRKFTRKDREKD
jgi:hypothetical protein